MSWIGKWRNQFGVADRQRSGPQLQKQNTGRLY
jgi:hypothetical protein